MALVRSLYAWRFKKLQIAKAALEARLVRLEPHTPIEELRRAGGDVLCGKCSAPYYDHPRHPSEEFLTILCDGSIVKL